MQYNPKEYAGRMLGTYPPAHSIASKPEKSKPTKNPSTNDLAGVMRDILPYLDTKSYDSMQSFARSICDTPRAPTSLGRGDSALISGMLSRMGGDKVARMLKLSGRFSGRRTGMKKTNMSEILRELGADEQTANMFNLFSKMQSGQEMNPLDMMSMMGGNEEMTRMMSMANMIKSMNSSTDAPSMENMMNMFSGMKG